MDTDAACGDLHDVLTWVVRHGVTICLALLTLKGRLTALVPAAERHRSAEVLACLASLFQIKG